MNDRNVDSPEVCVVRRAKQRDRDAHRRLFEQYRKVAFRVAARVTSNETDAMDVVQDSFIKAFGSLEGLDDESKFKTWLLRIVNNKALDLLRSRSVRKAASLERDDEKSLAASIPSSTFDDPDGGLVGQETNDRIRDAMDALPPEHRSTLSLFAAGGMTYGEIAEILGVPMGTVMSRLHRARQLMQEKLADLRPSVREKRD